MGLRRSAVRRMRFRVRECFPAWAMLRRPRRRRAGARGWTSLLSGPGAAKLGGPHAGPQAAGRRRRPWGGAGGRGLSIVTRRCARDLWCARPAVWTAGSRHIAQAEQNILPSSRWGPT